MLRWQSSSLQIIIQQSALAKSRAKAAPPAPGLTPWPSQRRRRAQDESAQFHPSGISSKQNSVSVQNQNQEINLPAAVSISDPRRDSSVQQGTTPKMLAQISGCQTTTSAATQPEFCAASTSKCSKSHLSTHSCKGSQCVGQLLGSLSFFGKSSVCPRAAVRSPLKGICQVSKT